MTPDELQARWGPEIEAEMAKRPPLSPDQVRAIRGIWLSIITEKASAPGHTASLSTDRE